MAFSKARRLSDFISANGSIPAGKFTDSTITSAHIVDATIVPADMHATLNLTGKTVTVATASGSTNSTAVASTAFVQQELTTLIGGAPSTLNDLNELAAAINDDANYNSTLTTALATKLPLAGGTLTGTLVINTSGFSRLDLRTARTGAADNIGGVQFLNNSNALKSQIYGSNDGTLRIATNGNVTAITLDASQNATFAGTIASGAITSTGKIEATQLDLVGTDNYIAYGSAGTAPSNGDYLRLRDVASGNDALQFYMDGSKLFSIDGQTGNAYHKGTISSGEIASGKITANGGAVYSETTQGAAKGTIHLDPDSATDHAGTALTFGASDSGSGNSAQAGIYTRSDGSYGTKIYISTTNDYGAGSKTALKIDHLGHLGIMRGDLKIGSQTVIDANKNLTNIGTIASGAITSTGKVQGNSLKAHVGSDDGSQLNLFADASGHCFIAGHTLRWMTGPNSNRTTRMYLSNTGHLTLNGNFYVNGSTNYLVEGSNGNNVSGARVKFLRTTDIRTPYSNLAGSNNIGGLFTSYALNNTSPYADAIYVQSYSDTSGGANNALMMSKSASNTKVVRYSFGSSSAWSSQTQYALYGTTGSDQRLKENVTDITNGLDIINSLRPVNFDWNDLYLTAGMSKNISEQDVLEEDQSIIIPDSKIQNVGLIAQEVEAVLPTVVHENNLSLGGTAYKNVSYEKIVPHLIAAIQEQQTLIESLTARIAALGA